MGVGYSPWGRKESDTTEHTHIHTQLFFAAQQHLNDTLRLFQTCLNSSATSHSRNVKPWAL